MQDEARPLSIGDVNDEQAENLSRAIAVMTAWNEGGQGRDFVSQVAADIMVEDEQSGSPTRLPAGLMSLCGILLTQLEKETGREPALTLQDIAARYRLKE